MTTADHRPGGACGAVLRWTRAAVIALVAALAVLVHHETVSAITHVPPVRASAGMHRTTAPAMSVHPSSHAALFGVTAPTAAHEDDGACSGTAMQHCSAAGVESLKLAPPHQLAPGPPAAVHPGAATGRDVPGSMGRAPPDLSVLSRLLL
ncbi:hypothetical protein [Streptomyces sp. NPDC005476]|uniref:hypothetical protein n=1 Tax=Streptomyces sp. NPDC005476 TaxID=3156882 RepID=UPI003455DFA4